MSMNSRSLHENKASFGSDPLAKFTVFVQKCVQRSKHFRHEWRVSSWRGSCVEHDGTKDRHKKWSLIDIWAPSTSRFVMRTATNGNISRQTELAPVPSVCSGLKALVHGRQQLLVSWIMKGAAVEERGRKREKVATGEVRKKEEERERESLGEEEAREREGNGGDPVLHHQWWRRGKSRADEGERRGKPIGF